MPTYEFKCRECGHLFERLLSISDNSKQECPVCGNNTQRLIFKGSGFYVNDYRKTGKTGKTVNEKSK